MIVPDVNLLLYAYDDRSPFHDSASRWWEGLLDGAEPIGLPWVVTTGFLRLLTNPRMYPTATTPEQAVDTVREWFSFPHVTVLNPRPDHLILIRRLLAGAGTGGNLVTDAHIAAIAIERGAEVHSNDRDFARFPGLRWRNPL